MPSGTNGYDHLAADVGGVYLTDFGRILGEQPPPLPDALLHRAYGRTLAADPSKVRVLIRLGPEYCEGDLPSELSIEGVDVCTRRLLLKGAPHGVGANNNGRDNNTDKSFVFDNISRADGKLNELSSASMVDVIQSVVDGRDACLFTYGHARLGKTFTMLGVDDHVGHIGVIPHAISWLFKLIDQKRILINKAQANNSEGGNLVNTTSIRYSVRISAIEVTTRGELLKDLLSAVETDVRCDGEAKPVKITEDPMTGRYRLVNQMEIRAGNAREAAVLLDAAISARSVPDEHEDISFSHMLFTMNVYQYHLRRVLDVSSSGAGGANGGAQGGAGEGQISATAGGRSCLHLLDLGSCGGSIVPSARDDLSVVQHMGGESKMSVQTLGDLLFDILHGNTSHNSDPSTGNLTRLLRCTLADVTSHVAMLVHVSPRRVDHSDTMATLQLAARVQRMRRRRNKMGLKAGSDSDNEPNRLVPKLGRAGLECSRRRKGLSSASSACDSMSDGGEISCDTVIYVGPKGQTLSDREFTDNEGPPPMAMLRSMTHLTKATHFIPAYPSLTSDPPLSAPATSKLRTTAAVHKSPRTVRREKTAAALAKRYRLRRKELWVEAVKDRAGRNEELWIDGPNRCRTKDETMERLSYDCFPPPAYSPTFDELRISPNINPCKPQPLCDNSENGERWVDGPREFTRTSTNHHSERASVEAMMGSWPSDCKDDVSASAADLRDERSMNSGIPVDIVNEFTATWLEKYHSVAYNLRCPVLTGAAGLQRGVKASPGNARKTKHANVSEVMPTNKRTAEWVSLVSTRRRCSDGGGGARGVFSPRTLRKIYTQEQTLGTPERVFGHRNTVPVNTATTANTTSGQQQHPRLRYGVDGQESQPIVQVEVQHCKETGPKGGSGGETTDTTTTASSRSTSRSTLRKPDGASNPSIPLGGLESPLPRKALGYRRLVQSRSLEFSVQNAGGQEVKSRSLTEAVAPPTLRYETRVAKHDAVVQLKDGVCIVTCAENTPYGAGLLVTAPGGKQLTPPPATPPKRASMFARLSRFISNPTRKSSKAGGVKLVARPALVRAHTDGGGGYRASLVCVAKPDPVDIAYRSSSSNGTTRVEVVTSRTRPEFRESSGYESFRNTDHTDASESAISDISSDENRASEKMKSRQTDEYTKDKFQNGTPIKKIGNVK